MPIPRRPPRAVDSLRYGIREGGIVFQLRQTELGSEARNDRLNQVAERIVRVRELGIGQHSGIARDVRDDQAALLGHPQHGPILPR